MGAVVLAGAVSHSPGLTGFPHRADPGAAGRVFAGFDALAAALADARPDAVVVVSPEHFTNFFVDNLPAFALGTASSYELPATDAFASFLAIPRRRYPGHAELGDALYRRLLAGGFDVSLVAGGYGFDEGVAVPLRLLVGGADVPVVPVVVNAVHEPYPTLGRCWELGDALGRAIAGQTVAPRVAVIATGGLSHWVGLPRAGEIDAAFDARILDRLRAGDAEALCGLTDGEIDAAGNGAHEIRTWVTVAAAAGGAAFEVLAYEAVPEWLTGTCVARALVSDGRGGK